MPAGIRRYMDLSNITGCHLLEKLLLPDVDLEDVLLEGVAVQQAVDERWLQLPKAEDASHSLQKQSDAQYRQCSCAVQLSGL